MCVYSNVFVYELLCSLKHELKGVGQKWVQNFGPEVVNLKKKCALHIYYNAVSQ